MQQVGLIGLGAMGSGMADNLAKAGCLYRIWNRTHSKAQLLADKLQVPVADSVQQLAADVDVVILCVSADSDVLAVIEQLLDDIKPGTVVIDTSTVSRATAITAAQLLAAKQVPFLDAPVSGGVEGAKNASLAMMVGGDEKVLAQVKPVLELIAERMTYMGANGSGQGTKAVNQVMAAGINQVVTEALAFAQAEGLPLEKVIEVVAGGAAGNWFLQHRGLSMWQARYQPGFKVVLHHKDLMICQSMAQENAAKLPLVRQTIADYQTLIDAGFGEEDISALYRLKQK